MKVICLASSTLAAYQYLADDQVLLLWYKSGALYARTAVSRETVAGLSAAPSKGKFLAQCKGPDILISKGDRGNREIKPEPGPADPNATDSRQPMQTHEPDPCCGARISAAMREGALVDSWVCPKCATEWRPHKMTAGAIHWMPFIPVVVFR